MRKRKKQYVIYIALLYIMGGLMACMEQLPGDAEPDKDSRTPIDIGNVLMANTLVDTPLRSTRGVANGSGNFVFAPGDKIELQIISAVDNSTLLAYGTYSLQEGSTWKSIVPLYLEALPLDASAYFIRIGSNGGWLIANEDKTTWEGIEGTRLWSNLQADQSTPDYYYQNDLIGVDGALLVGKDIYADGSEHTLTQNDISTTVTAPALNHLTIDVLISIVRGKGWGEVDAAADAAFTAYMEPCKVKLLTKEDGTPFASLAAGITAAAGETAIRSSYRAHTSLAKIPDSGSVLFILERKDSQSDQSISCTYALPTGTVLTDGCRLTVSAILDNNLILKSPIVEVTDWTEERYPGELPGEPIVKARAAAKND